MEVLREFDYLLASWQRLCGPPLWRCDELPQRAPQRPSMSGDKRLFLVNLFAPAVAKPYLAAETTAQERDATLAVIALVRYRSRHRAWPATLIDLGADYLPEVPLDRFTGKPLKYRLRGGRPYVYSVGADRDDDGGEAVVEADGPRPSKWVPPSEARSAVDGDWVLWPTSEAKEDRFAGFPYAIERTN